MLIFLWRKLTHTKALEESSGSLETAFFEGVYRVTYLAGLSLVDRSWLYLLYSGTIKVMMILFVCSEIWYLFGQSNSLDEFVENINVTLIHLIAIYRYKDMMEHKDMFKTLATSMESPYFDISTQDRQKLVDFWLKQDKRYFKLLLGLGTCTLAAWYIYPLVDDLEYNLTVAVRLPFEYNTPIRYPITYLVVLIAFNYTSYFVMVNDLIMVAHLMHLVCQFMVLGDCFQNILQDCEQESKDNIEKNSTKLNADFKIKYISRLRNLVDQHKFILKHAMDLKQVMSTPMLCQLGASSMLICFVGYQVTATLTESITKFLMTLLYLGYNLVELFIFCRWCDEIKIQSENIRDAVYCSGWERQVATIPGVRACLMTVMIRASRPVDLTAGGLMSLSLTTYTSIVKTSYSALTVLLRLRFNSIE